MGKRIVLDTNVLVSALGWKGAERTLLTRCRAGLFQLVISPQLLNELERVLHYKKLNFAEEEQAEFLALISEIAIIVEPDEVFDIIIEDPQDNRILECACKGRAEIIVSGDEHLLRLNEFRGISIMRAPDAVNVERV